MLHGLMLMSQGLILQNFFNLHTNTQTKAIINMMAFEFILAR